MHIILFLSAIPIIDKIITKFIYNLNYLKFISNSQFIKSYILYINIIVYIFIAFYVGLWKIVLNSALFDLFIINFLFKWCLNRRRPNESLFAKEKEYHSIFKTYPTLNWSINQSFPSSHVSFTYSIYRLSLCANQYWLSKVYLILTIFMIIFRINKGAHYFSDCCFAILFYQLFYNLII